MEPKLSSSTNPNHISSDSSSLNEVFPDVNDSNTKFQTTKSKSKRSHPSTSSSEKVYKITKPVFVSTNRFNILNTSDNLDDSEIHNVSKNNPDSITEQINSLPPPIFVRNVGNFIELHNHLINLVGSDNLFFKSSANNLKISTKTSDSYRAVITYLKSGKAEYYTYQAHDNKAFRIVIRNLHPTTSTTEIGSDIESLGYNVHQVSNVLDKSIKRPFPIFFVDLEPAPINNEIFNLTSILHTKIKIEEPYKRREIIPTANNMTTRKATVLIILDVYVVLPFIPLLNVPNQPALQPPVSYVGEITLLTIVAVQSTKTCRKLIKNQIIIQKICLIKILL
ncbi:Pre-C2HC domain [Cinara cedri]|uniref:Pre-C2HC domain n=1 Tax=Cinara cedri TaxID=506608 RepID=A0A5E4NSP7_9HEMI|nr:Pre-C2HC domain [Cinara cedri]